MKLVRAKRGKKMTWKSEDTVRNEWFTHAISETHFRTLHEAKTSPKLTILAHILAFALQKGDKILIYSKDLKTLDMVELFLGERDWRKQVNLGTFGKLGGWEKNKDFARIDGSINSSVRGDLVDRFNSSSTMKAFLISALAGGIGINLVSFCPHLLCFEA